MKLQQIAGALALTATLGGCEEPPGTLNCDQMKAEMSNLQGNKDYAYGIMGDLQASRNHTRKEALRVAAAKKNCELY